MPAKDHNDFIWERFDETPLPPAPPGETALEALFRRVRWTRLIWTDKAIPNRYRVLAAWDDLTPEQQAELEGVNIFDLRHGAGSIKTEYFDELPDGKMHGLIKPTTQLKVHGWSTDGRAQRAARRRRLAA